MSKCSFCILALSFAAASIRVANANSLTPPNLAPLRADVEILTSNGSLQWDTDPLAGVYTTSVPMNAQFGNGTAYIQTSPIVNVGASVYNIPTGTSNTSQQVWSDLWYDFSIQGPANKDTVHAEVTTNLFAYGSGANASADDTVYVYSGSWDNPFRTLLSYVSTCGGNIFCTATNNKTVPFTIDLGDVSLGSLYSIFVQANASAGDGFAKATADPYVFVDPSISDAADYTVLVSDGITNAPALTEAPLPGTAALFGTGLGALAILGRRRKKKPANA